MAVTFTQLAVMSTSTAQASSYTQTGSTHLATDILVTFALVSDTTAVGTMTGGGWTWAKLLSATKNSNLDTLYVFWAKVTGTGGTNPIIDVTGDAGTGALIYTLRVAGQEGNQPYLRQMKTNTGSTANPSVTMDKAILTGNGVIGAVCNGTNSAAQFTAPTSWTERNENTFNTPPNAMQVSMRSTGETGSTITWTCANTTPWVAIVIEWYVAGTGPTEGDPMGMNGMFGAAF